ncbi:histidine phosphatase family protein [Romboutsia sedimentorum]|uniref:histidine phosphatase family protein n=1 Tax=Romboutsia sedimentorum TaxID=1368474 RepID=UPI0024DE4CFA|nr:histidine phosphatase family protein [Romboutsia sedimentorum]MDK2584558.1 histidine phosphatase family protein [Romboutsia sedimentorum]
MKIYITRHGQTEWNVEGRMQGAKNSNLTQQGKKEALNLGNSLKDTKIDYIYTSPLTRAYDTALLIKSDREIDVEVYENLKEMNFGIWEGMHSDDVVRDYEEEHYKFWNEPHLYTPIGGETFESLINRVKIALSDIINQNKGENILLVTHTVVIKAIYAIVKDYEIKDFWNPPYIKNTCVTILECNEGSYKFILEADTSHVEN